MKRGREEQSNDNSRLAEMMPLASAVRRTPPSPAPKPHRHADCASTDRAPAVDKARRPIQFSPAHMRRAMVSGSAIKERARAVHGAVLRAPPLRLARVHVEGLGHAPVALLAHPLPRVRVLRRLNPGKRQAAYGPEFSGLPRTASPPVLCCAAANDPSSSSTGPRTPFALSRPKAKLSHVSITSASVPPSAPRSTPRATPAGPRPSPADTPARRPRAAG